jgi:hypothetical protein
VVALALNMTDPQFRLSAALLLALGPVAVVYLTRKSPLLYAVLKPRSDPRADLAFVLIVAGFGLLMRLRGIHLVSAQTVMIAAAAIGVALTALLSASVPSGAGFAGRLIALLLFAGPYAYSVVVIADALPDRAEPASFTATVVGKHVSRGGRSTSYVLTLSPWGPIEGPNNLDTPASNYARVSIGDPVCLLLHPGVVHIEWYERIPCPVRPWYANPLL